MKRIVKWISTVLVITLLFGLLLSGCASTAIDEQEGGITGTGNSINCDDEKNRKHKLCRQHKREFQ